MGWKHAARMLILILGSMFCQLSLQGQALESARQTEGPYLRVGVTYVGIDTDSGPWAAAEVAYLGSTPKLWRAGLIAGLVASTHGTVYGYGGIHLPVSLPLGILVRPSFAVGIYERGRGMELGHALEFRSSFVVERLISDRVRVSAMIYHLSNAGLGFKNPGLEALGIGVAFPIPNHGLIEDQR